MIFVSVYPFMLAFYYGMSHAETSAKVQCPRGTVKTWIRREFDQLRMCLEARQAMTRNDAAQLYDERACPCSMRLTEGLANSDIGMEERPPSLPNPESGTALSMPPSGRESMSPTRSPRVRTGSPYVTTYIVQVESPRHARRESSSRARTTLSANAARRLDIRDSLYEDVS